jgi:hypothetical protein
MGAVAGITVLHGLPVAPKPKKSLITLKAVAIMQLATRVSRGTLYKLERSTRSMMIKIRAADLKKPTVSAVGFSRGRTIHVRNRRLDSEFSFLI